MNALVRSLILVILATATATIHADEIYRWETPDGTTVYSDKPQPNTSATKIKQSLVPTVHLQNVKISDIPKKIMPESLAYQSIEVTSPQDGTAFPTPPSTVLVSASIKPALRDGHQVLFLKDGSPVSAPSTATSASITDIHRGSHLLQAQIVDSAGKVLIRSRPITISVQQPSVIKQ